MSCSNPETTYYRSKLQQCRYHYFHQLTVKPIFFRYIAGGHVYDSKHWRQKVLLSFSRQWNLQNRCLWLQAYLSITKCTEQNVVLSHRLLQLWLVKTIVITDQPGAENPAKPGKGIQASGSAPSNTHLFDILYSTLLICVTWSDTRTRIGKSWGQSSTPCCLGC
jgi:hypothetical protein